jgi:hypothetical protein
VSGILPRFAVDELADIVVDAGIIARACALADCVGLIDAEKEITFLGAIVSR